MARAERAAREALALEAAARPDAEMVGGDIESDADREAWQRYLDEQARAG